MGKRLDHSAEQGSVRYSVRIPYALYVDLVGLADERGWPLHTEIMQALRQHARRRDGRRGQRREEAVQGRGDHQSARAAAQERAP